jgi:chromosome segregation ATPase
MQLCAAAPAFRRSVHSLRAVVLAICAVAAVFGLTGCQSVYYTAWEAFGKEKRDLLRDELRGMVGDQKEAQETFTDALTQVKALTGFDGGDLERKYESLKSSFEDAEDSADQIDDRIADIERVADDLFEEWEQELTQMGTASLREASRGKLRDTRRRFDRMDRTLRDAREKMVIVLAVFRDHVLYLKHNLNAAAIGDLGKAMGEVESSISDLQGSIEQSIREAQSFIEAMP